MQQQIWLVLFQQEMFNVAHCSTDSFGQYSEQYTVHCERYCAVHCTIHCVLCSALHNTICTVQCREVCDVLCCWLAGRSCSGGTTALACSGQQLINKLCFCQISAALYCGATMRGGRRSENNRAVLSDPFQQPRNTKNMQ